MIKIETTSYTPGVCNIGPAERRARRLAGWIGVVMTVALEVIFILSHTPQIWRLFLFLPASLGASGFLQSAFHFCAAFGMKSVFNLGPEVGKIESVHDKEARKKDRRKAQLIMLLSGLIGALFAGAGYLIRW